MEWQACGVSARMSVTKPADAAVAQRRKERREHPVFVPRLGHWTQSHLHLMAWSCLESDHRVGACNGSKLRQTLLHPVECTCVVAPQFPACAPSAGIQSGFAASTRRCWWLSKRNPAEDWLTGLAQQRARFRILPDCVECHDGLDRDVPKAVFLRRRISFPCTPLSAHGPPKTEQSLQRGVSIPTALLEVTVQRSLALRYRHRGASDGRTRRGGCDPDWHQKSAAANAAHLPGVDLRFRFGAPIVSRYWPTI
ncbi:hypothetical protein LMG28727_07174 [Paraburkholderia kirstenboschensis]|nr:hypothetical protein LMG28727_07174 [Paraburkholderia kirstenboschensis]